MKWSRYIKQTSQWATTSKKCMKNDFFFSFGWQTIRTWRLLITQFSISTNKFMVKSKHSNVWRSEFERKNEFIERVFTVNIIIMLGKCVSAQGSNDDVSFNHENLPQVRSSIFFIFYFSFDVWISFVAFLVRRRIILLCSSRKKKK